MKKTMIILSALLALVACNKENPQNEGVIDPSKVVFNINVQTADDAATKGVKTGWVNGDVVYVFFEENTDQYVKMTFDGSFSTWSYSDKDGGTSYTDLTLAESGKHLSAVYMPGFVTGGTAPDYKSSKWTIGEGLGGYILMAETAEYSITSREGNIVTLEATLDMTAPANLVQVYTAASAPASGNEYVLNMTNVKPFTFDGIVPGGAATITTGTANFPLPGYAGTLGSDAGYYFWGILANASLGSTNYTFQLVEQNADKKYAISSKSKTVTTTISGPKAVKVSLSDKGNFVSMGYAGGPLWATGNLNDDGSIADPLKAGDYYKWCYTTPYDMTGETDAFNNYYTGEYTTDRDPAFVKSGGAWCLPSKAQYDALQNNTNANNVLIYRTNCWKTGWTELGNDNGGALLTSKANGISLFFAAAGSYYNGSLFDTAGDYGYYWSSTPYDSDIAYYLYFRSDDVFTDYYIEDRYGGHSVRPVYISEGTGSGQNFTWNE